MSTSLDKELMTNKERQDIELCAQKATLQQQRSHIEILESALGRAQQNVNRLEDDEVRLNENMLLIRNYFLIIILLFWLFSSDVDVMAILGISWPQLVSNQMRRLKRNQRLIGKWRIWKSGIYC